MWGEDKDGRMHTPPLETEADWIKAGEIVFRSGISFLSYPVPGTPGEAYIRGVFKAIDPPLLRSGLMPFGYLVVREKGNVEIAFASCAECHTRSMPDETLVLGAQGNFPLERGIAFNLSKGSSESARIFERALFAAPWVDPDPLGPLQKMQAEEIASVHRVIPPGVIARNRSSSLYPVHVPDLIGVKDRRYLDATGLQQHRSIVDLMRYAALNQGADNLASYNGFIPSGSDFNKLPEPNKLRRYSDEQLYALALFIYSLKPPPNPHRFDSLAARGQKIFQREGCAGCHTPPLYTNNMLTPVAGFEVPQEHLNKYQILPVRVGTDQNLTMKTRRGTGYYKVPSLKGVWYRSMFSHDGSCAKLEDWFDPRRLRSDYVPTGFKGYGIQKRAVPGHEFGLKLSADDKNALLAFLRTL